MISPTEPQSPLARFLDDLRPLLAREGAREAYVFGSYARGDADRYSDIDVIVVAPTDRIPVERFRDYLPAIASAERGVDMLVYTPAEFDRLRAEGRAFLVAALEDARQVYPSERGADRTDRGGHPVNESAREGERWLLQAENDLEFGRLALREGFFAQACFVAQQTGEKALKAVAYHLGERVVLGHSLVDLVRRLQGQVPELKEYREAAGVLDQYYVPTRYPNGLPGGSPFEAFNETQGRQALEEAEAFVSLAGKRIRDR